MTRRLGLFSLVIFAFLLLAPIVWPQSPKAANSGLQKGIDLYNQGDYKAAAGVFRSISTAGRDSAEASYWLGLSLFQARDASGATEAFQNALDGRDGHYPEAESQIGLLLLITGDFGEAVRHFHQALSDSNGVQPDAHFDLGLAHWRMDNYDDARAEMYSGITQRMPFPDALYALGVMLYEQKNYDESGPYLKKYLEAQPQSPRSDRVRYLLANWDRILAIPEGGTLGLEKPSIRKAPAPRSTREAKAMGVRGKIIVECVFTASGKVEDPVVIRSLGFGLDEMALAAARKIKFKPARENLTPVTVRMRVEMFFE